MANHRSFSITMASSGPHNLLALALIQTNAVPTDGIFPNPVSSLRITSSLTNEGALITVEDDYTTDGGQVLGAGDQFIRESHRNTINLGEYLVTSETNDVVFSLDVEQN